MKKLLIALICCLLMGCASNYKVLRNNKGDYVKCTSSGYGLMGSYLANQYYKDCIKNAEEKGYK